MPTVNHAPTAFAFTTADQFESNLPGYVYALPTAVDLFAGPGGWDEGAKQGLGEDVAAGILGFEFEKNAVATARAAGHARVYGDLSKVNPAFFKAPGLIASPPCQGFSPAGKGKGREDFERLEHAIGHVRSGYFTIEEAIEWLEVRIADPKSALILEPIRWAIRMAEAPRWLAFEQVKTVLPIWEAMADLLRDLGYSVWTGLVHSEEYGVPQTRTRAVLLGSLDKDVSGGPVATHSRYNHRHTTRQAGEVAAAAGLERWVSMADALGTEPVLAWPERDEIGDADWTYNRPSVTMVGSYRPDVAAAPGWRKPGDGPRQNAVGSVVVTQQQSGVIQSFPADYPWQGSDTARYQQSGNAVPCLMAAAMLETVR